MLYTNNTEKMLGLQGVIVKNIKDNKETVEIEIEVERQEQNCPCCAGATRAIHDYRKQKVKDISAFGKRVVLIYRKRRYACKCGKKFIEKNEFLPRYHRMTSRLVAHVIEKLREVTSFSQTARETGLSVSTVIRVFDLVEYPKPKLPEVLSIDEFKGNTNGEKYQVILTDPKNGVVLDILPERYLHSLKHYFRWKDKDNIKYFISDMWKSYRDLSESFPTPPTFIVDKYHWIRQIIWAFEAVRKQEQKKFSKSHRIYFKRSKSLLIKRFDFLEREKQQQVLIMLDTSVNLSDAYFLKEQFLKILDCKDRQQAKLLLNNWILNAHDSSLPQFRKCASTMQSWITGILNSFEFPFTNGFTEGCNNKIKVLKRNAYGYRNFKRFRNRILHIFSYQSTKLKQETA